MSAPSGLGASSTAEIKGGGSGGGGSHSPKRRRADEPETREYADEKGRATAETEEIKQRPTEAPSSSSSSSSSSGPSTGSSPSQPRKSPEVLTLRCRPHYSPPSDFALTAAQAAGAAAVAAGHDVLFVGGPASGKSTAVSAGLAECHVTVPDIAAALAFREGTNLLAAPHERDPFWEFNSARVFDKVCAQRAEDELHAGRRKIQLGHLASHVGVEKTAERLAKMAEPHVATSGRVCLVAWDEPMSRTDNAVFQLLRSPWFAAHAGTGAFQLVGVLCTTRDGQRLSDGVERLAAERGVKVFYLSRVDRDGTAPASASSLSLPPPPV
jgi:hypothetical protein